MLLKISSLINAFYLRFICKKLLSHQIIYHRLCTCIQVINRSTVEFAAILCRSNLLDQKNDGYKKVRIVIIMTIIMKRKMDETVMLIIRLIIIMVTMTIIVIIIIIITIIITVLLR